MQAVILAAGEGKRLRPLTSSMPKVMIPVGNKPIMEYVVNALVKNNIRDIIMVVGYHADKVKRYFGDGSQFGANIKYIHQEKQLGTAHALYQVGKIDDFIVLPGDNIIGEKCIKDIISSDRNTILVVYSERASKYGSVEVKNGVVMDIKEKYQSVNECLIFTGVGHFDSMIFDLIKKALSEEIYDLPPILKTINSLKAKISSCPWLDAVYPWDLLELNSNVLRSTSRILSGKIENATILGNVSIGEGSVISAGAYIKGPVKIGKNCFIGPNTVIMPDTSIGDGTKIGAFAYIENSIIMDGAIISEGAYIKNAVVGKASVLGPKSVLLSGNFSKIINGNDVIRKCGGPVIGHRVNIGAGTVINPGVLIGSDASIGNMKEIWYDVEPKARVR